MPAFEVIRNHRDTSSELSATKKIKRPYRSSTKNNIHHFASLLKRLLIEKHNMGIISHRMLIEVSSILLRATSLTEFARGYSFGAIRKIFAASCQNGDFIRLLMGSDIEPMNKSAVLVYVNVLMNSFKTGKLSRWIQQEVKVRPTVKPASCNLYSLRGKDTRKSTSSVSSQDATDYEEESALCYATVSQEEEIVGCEQPESSMMECDAYRCNDFTTQMNSADKSEMGSMTDEPELNSTHYGTLLVD